MIVANRSSDECQMVILENPFLSLFSLPTFVKISTEKLGFSTEQLHVLPYILLNVSSSKMHHL